MNKTIPMTQHATPTAEISLRANTENGASFCLSPSYFGKSFIALLRGKLSYLARLAQHLVDFAEMSLFFGNHLASILFKQHRTIANQIQKSFVKFQTLFLGVQRLQENIVNPVFVRFEQ